MTSVVQIATGQQAGWNYVPRRAFAPPVLAVALAARWNPLPSSVLTTAWFEALALFVGMNTVIFAVLSLLQMLPPVRRTLHRRAGRSAAS